MKNKTMLAASVAAAATGISATADATTYTAVLTEVRIYTNSGTSGTPANITSSTATFSYDDATSLISQTGGLFNLRVQTVPTSTLYRTSITGLVLGNGAAASATTYVCTEGNFGGSVGASICGNYNFGANFGNESTTTWGPGTATSRTIGGDDFAIGVQQSINLLDGMTTISWVGTTLVLRNGTCTGTCTTTAGGFNYGQQWTFSAGPQVPVPAAAWLFGGALGLLGVARRRSA
ncbi:MAG: hypothetical protein ABIX37_03045 [Gammaproteobacteria bacterium]